MGSEDDLDLYAYVGGDPINRGDPTGQYGDFIHDLGKWVNTTSNNFAKGVVNYAGGLQQSATNIMTGKGSGHDFANIGNYYGNVAAAVSLATPFAEAAPSIEAASGSRGLSKLGGVFSAETNAAGGEVWTSTGSIAQKDFTSIVNGGLYKGDVNILTGVHGAADGTMTVDSSLFKADVAKFGDIPGVTVHNLPDMTSSQVTNVLESKGTTIGGFCNSAACLSSYTAK